MALDNVKENIPFTFERGKCKFNGRTNDDRKNLKLEIILYWIWRIILAICGLFGANGIYKIFFS